MEAEGLTFRPRTTTALSVWRVLAQASRDGASEATEKGDTKMSESKRPRACADATTDELEYGLVEDVLLEAEDEVAHDEPVHAEDDDVLWVPAKQPAKSGFLGQHHGELVLLVTCDDCGNVTHTTPDQHLFVPCAHCPGEITLTWKPGEG